MEKDEKYRLLTAQIKALTEGERDVVSVMANCCAAIHETMGFFWTGFYVVGDCAPETRHGEDAAGQELRLGPFQGPVACMHIGYGRGVCGTAWQQGRTIVVDDVEQFPGHIACSSLSRSEIVVPARDTEGKIRAVLDIDSRKLAAFDATDQLWLEQIVALINWK